MKRLSRPLILALLAVTAIVSLWTPLVHHDIAQRWFSLPGVLFFLPVPILFVLAAWGLWRAALRDRSHYAPFMLALLLIFLGYSGLGISVWPNLIPPDISFRAASSPPQSQGFMLVGALFIIPLILVYTFWSYYVFRGKVTHDQGYH